MYLLFPVAFVIFMSFIPSLKFFKYLLTILIFMVFLGHFYFSPWKYYNTINRVLLNSTIF